MRITPITQVTKCNIEMNYEEMVMLRALLARARKSREAAAAKYYNPFDYGQSETASSSFLHDLHHKLIELTGVQHE